ncbi:MAG TPA: DUF1223 domain-containing protein [Pyrinomonadaceae bacterium]|nr:DUF1223 domain-containing protein [Pyrinomonadaceae bacterium]
MRFLSILLVLAVSFVISGCGGANESTSNADPAMSPSQDPPGRKPVLVELFTSEGCGNCPPADRYLAFLETKQPIQGAEVITLGYHVDYFNDRGWKDPYSSEEYTRRQNLYALRMGQQSVFTPQMIVDGVMQFVGNDANTATKTIQDATRAPKPDVSISVIGKTAEVKLTGFGRHNVATVVLATAEDGLVSDVKAGNNRGKQLSHISVVRQLKPFGKLPEKATEFSGTVELPSDPAWKAENVRYVVFVQEDQSGTILAAGRVPIP